MDNFLIPSGVVAIVSLLATLVMLAKRQYENAFTRAYVTVVYVVLTFLPLTPIEIARNLSRWGWVLVLGVEIVWWVTIGILRRRRK